VGWPAGMGDSSCERRSGVVADESDELLKLREFCVGWIVANSDEGRYARLDS